MKIVPVQETYPSNSRFALFLLILALFINFLVLFILFIIQVDTSSFIFNTQHEEAPVVFEQMPEQPSLPEPPQTALQEIAALKPGASNLGVPDDFDENQMKAQISNPEIKDNESTPTQEQEEEKKNDYPLEKIATQLLKAPTLEKIKQPEPQKTVTQQQQDTQKIKAPLTKELTFNDLAKGFLSSIDEGGNDLIERKGNENIRPDFEEMRILSYQHKIFWCIQNECKRTNINLNFPVPPFIVTNISMTIDKEGNLEKVSVTHSCGVHQLDDFIVQSIRNASPFPPLPSFLNKDRYIFDFGVKHVPANYNGLNRSY